MRKNVVIAGASNLFGQRLSNILSTDYNVIIISKDEADTKEISYRIKNAKFYSCNVNDIRKLQETFWKIDEEQGSIDIMIYNVGGFLKVNNINQNNRFDKEFFDFSYKPFVTFNDAMRDYCRKKEDEEENDKIFKMIKSPDSAIQKYDSRVIIYACSSYYCNYDKDLVEQIKKNSNIIETEYLKIRKCFFESNNNTASSFVNPTICDKESQQVKEVIDECFK